MQKFNLNLSYIFYLLLVLSSFLSQATNFNHQDIELLAWQHLQNKYLADGNASYQVSISKPKLDPRIQLNQCDTDLLVNILENQNSRNINVKISCNSPAQWQIYLPAKVQKLFPVLVAKTNLRKGSTLTQDNTFIDYIAEYKIRGATLSSNEHILGAKLKRNLQKNTPIYNNNICLVCKGDTVNIVAGSEQFSIKTDGIALTSGVLHEQVRVKNNRSGKHVVAEVKTPNKVVINL